MGADKGKKISSMVASMAEDALSRCDSNGVVIVTVLKGKSSIEWGNANKEVLRPSVEIVNRAAKKTIPLTRMNS
jgi:hypothetical protein